MRCPKNAAPAVYQPNKQRVAQPRIASTAHIESPAWPALPRQSAIQRSRWGLLGGITTGGLIGFATAGPIGAIPGMVGGAVLGPAIEWWHALPRYARSPIRPDDLQRQGLRQAPPRNVHVPTTVHGVTVQDLQVPGRGLTQTPPRNIHVPTTAHGVTLHDLRTRQQGLTNVPAPQVAPAIDPTNIPLIDVTALCVPLSQQTKGKSLGEMIQLPPGIKSGSLLYRITGVNRLATDVLRVGIFNVSYRYATQVADAWVRCIRFSCILNLPYSRS
jgi:hypothetical protein